jgi:hypothetical protein
MPSPTDPPNTNNRQAASPFAPATDVCTTAHALAHSGGIAPCCVSTSNAGVVATGHRERHYQGPQGIRPGAGAYHDGRRHPAARVSIVNAGLVRHLRINERAHTAKHTTSHLTGRVSSEHQQRNTVDRQCERAPSPSVPRHAFCLCFAPRARPQVKHVHVRQRRYTVPAACRRARG